MGCQSERASVSLLNGQVWYSVYRFIGDGDKIVSGSGDGIARIWDARLQAESKERIRGHSDSVWSVAISVMGRGCVPGIG